jgi:hypothetical protein
MGEQILHPVSGSGAIGVQGEDEFREKRGGRGSSWERERGMAWWGRGRRVCLCIDERKQHDERERALVKRQHWESVSWLWLWGWRGETNEMERRAVGEIGAEVVSGWSEEDGRFRPLEHG